LYGHQLARLLTAAGKKGVNFNTLQLNSYAFNSEKAQYVFLFDYPAGSLPKKPTSLHECIDGGVKLDLKERFRVAQALVRSIGAFHAVGWLHKGIRSHSIKFFHPKDGPACDFNRPYLTDFGFSRPVHMTTRFHAQAVGDPDYEVYRHPERYDPPVVSFTKIHDIYSVGVILLEIGLWQTARRLFDDVIEVDLGGKIPAAGRLASAIQSAFSEEARDRLGHRMGSSYRDAVLCCLGGELDDFTGNRDFANEFQKRVVEKVDFRLKED
jgi:serine/threonine protein kinase